MATKQISPTLSSLDLKVPSLSLSSTRGLDFDKTRISIALRGFPSSSSPKLMIPTSISNFNLVGLLSSSASSRKESASGPHLTRRESASGGLVSYRSDRKGSGAKYARLGK